MEDGDRAIYASNGMNREQVGEQVSEQVGEQEMTIPDRPKSRLQKILSVWDGYIAYDQVFWYKGAGVEQPEIADIA